MKLVVIKYLNARIENANTHSTCKYYRIPGDVLEINEVLIGEEIEGNAVWYKATDDGSYYWSGGLQDPGEVIRNAESFTREEQFQIYRNAVNFFSALLARTVSGFKGLAAGYKESGNIRQEALSLVVYVTTKETITGQGIVPAFLVYKGIRVQTDVRPTGINSFHNDLIFKDPIRPFMMGGSLAQVGNNGAEVDFGTRGALVKSGADTCLLTCYHVACFSLLASGKKSYDGTNIQINIPARVSESPFDIISGKVIRGSIGSYYDFALVAVPEPGQFGNTVDSGIFQGYYNAKEIQDAFLKNIRLTKFGARNEHKRSGGFRAYHSDAVTVDDKSGFTMSGLIETENISGEGDSGAPVVDESNKLLGFIVAGNPAKSSYILPFAVIKTFGIDLIK